MSTHARQGGAGLRTVILLLIAAIAGLAAPVASAQDDGQVQRIIRIGGQTALSGYLISWVDVSPDGTTVAASATQGFPFRFFPTDRPEEVRSIDVGNWYAGSRARYSPTGRYMILQQLFYLDFAPNKDRPIKYELVDVASGGIVRTFDDLFAVAEDLIRRGQAETSRLASQGHSHGGLLAGVAIVQRPRQTALL